MNFDLNTGGYAAMSEKRSEEAVEEGEGEEEEEEGEEEEEEEEIITSCLCLFCNREQRSAGDTLEHCRTEHGVDVVGIATQLGEPDTSERQDVA